MYGLFAGDGIKRVTQLEKTQQLDQFLAGVERKAFRMAALACRNDADALDIVQDAMLKLATKYVGRDSTEWGPLFHRILQTTINDWYRRQKVRSRWQVVLSFAGLNKDDKVDENPIENAPDRESQNPAEQLHLLQSMETLEGAIQALPMRQQQAFLLRVWDGLSVQETADAMSCSQGSVKTHYSRAIHVLREKLEGME